MPTLRPEVQAVLDANAAANLPDFADLSPAQARAMFLELRVAPPELVPIAHVEDRRVAFDGLEVPVRIYRPSDEASLPVLVWFHGGGWVLGDLESGELPARHLAAHTPCVVVSVDYRLAPEHPFPAAFEDCMAVTRWVAATADQLRVDPQRLAVGGDSAGGNLAACVAVEAASTGLELCHQLLVYPVVEDDFETDSYRTFSEGFFLSRAGMRWFWDQYVAHGHRTDPRVAPRRGDRSAVAPAWVYTAGCDPLCSEGRAYADELEAFGVPVERMEVDDVIHGVFSMTLDCGTEAREAAALALAAAFGRAD